MMVLGGTDVSPAFHRHQERQDPHLLATGALRPHRHQGPPGDRRSNSENSTTRGGSAPRPWPNPSWASSASPGCSTIPPPSEPITVDLKRLRLERGRRFGDVWLAWQLWRALGLDRRLEQLLPRGREDVPWAAMAAVLVIARLCEPRSELHIAEYWYRQTALDDLLGHRRGQGQRRSVVPRPGPSAAAQGGLGTAHQGPTRHAVPARLRPVLVRHDQHLFRGPGGRQPPGQAGLLARPAARLHAGLHRPWWSRAKAIRWATRSSRATATMPRPSRQIVAAMEQRYGQGQRIWVMDRGHDQSGEPEVARGAGLPLHRRARPRAS